MTDFHPGDFVFPRKRGRPRLALRLCPCGRRAYADNVYCQRCKRRVERHGDPAIALARGRKKDKRMKEASHG